MFKHQIMRPQTSGRHPGAFRHRLSYMGRIIKPAQHNNTIVKDDVADGTIVGLNEGEGTGTCRLGQDMPNHATMNHSHYQLVRMIGRNIVQTPLDALMKNVCRFSTGDDIPALLLPQSNIYRVIFRCFDPEDPPFPIAQVHLM